MENFINEKFSTRAKNALKVAQNIAKELGHARIGVEHLIFGILAEKSSFAAEVLQKNHVTEELIRQELIRRNAALREEAKTAISDDLRKTLEKAAIVAAKYQYQFIGTEHFLFGIVDDNSAYGQGLLKQLNLDPSEIKKNLLSIFESVSRFPEFASLKDAQKEAVEEQGAGSAAALEYFAVDLTEKARAKSIDPLIGRQKEIDRLISILNRRTKNNPVLIGDPGVGKTAIVEGLALAIRDRHVPDSLLGKRILALDLALIVAGSMFRGEFENRLKQIIEEVKNAKDIILFIDELHTMVGAGATTGSLDAANILKPALARGELRAIGATTLQEYRKYIEQDPALERRFQPIIIREPDPEEALSILKGLRPHYETHHGVEIADEALDAAVKLSIRYLTDRFLPDKALDLVDETASYRRMMEGNKTKGLSLKKTERDIADLADLKKQAVISEDFQMAEVLKKQEAKLLQTKQKLLAQKEAGLKRPGVRIDDTHIAETVARMTGIPTHTLLAKEAQKLLNLEKNLKKHIIGQDEAVREIASSIRRSRAGISSTSRPLGSFMFLGPSGVGKTHIAKLLARELFQNDQALVRIDMSEFMERHNVSRLIGAPAGYVGYEEGGRLTEIIRRRPYSVILFDEIEKAHRDVSDILLQILEEGELTDASGKKINFRNAIIIMTSNLGHSSLSRWAKSFGFAETGKDARRSASQGESIKHEVLTLVREHFRPEFVNRIDKVLVFDPLSQEDIKKIVKLELQNLARQLAVQGIELQYGKRAIEWLAKRSFDAVSGARMIRKNLQDEIENKIASEILRKKIGTGEKIFIDVSDENEPHRVEIKRLI